MDKKTVFEAKLKKAERVINFKHPKGGRYTVVVTRESLGRRSNYKRVPKIYARAGSKTSGYRYYSYTGRNIPIFYDALRNVGFKRVE